MVQLQGYKCHLAEEVVLSNKYNERAKAAMEYVKAIGGDKLVSAEEADVILTMGGDGTMLKAIHEYYGRLGETAPKKTFFGFAFGTANFLMNDFNWEDVKNIVDGKTPIQEQTVKGLFVKGPNGVWEFAVNDVVIGGEDLMSWLHFDVEDQEMVFGSFEGTGLIFSTAVGSTAWNKNNGGVVLPLLSANISVTGVGTNRQIKEVIHAQPVTVKYKSRSDCYIWVDGRDKKIGPFREATTIVGPGPNVKLGFFDAQKYQIKRRQA
jgi:NAD+ kinase